MGFGDNYMVWTGMVAGALTLGTCGTAEWFNAPLETGYYPGEIDGKPAILEVAYGGENIRNCHLTMRVSDEDKEIETINDRLCNTKNPSLDSNENISEYTVSDLKQRIRTAEGWAIPENKISADQAIKYLKQ